jgi:hypothetical protein
MLEIFELGFVDEKTADAAGLHAADEIDVVLEDFLVRMHQDENASNSGEQIDCVVDLGSGLVTGF